MGRQQGRPGRGRMRWARNARLAIIPALIQAFLSMTHALHTSALKSLPLLARGKVRDNYAVGDDRILMVASDRLSAPST